MVDNGEYVEDKKLIFAQLADCKQFKETAAKAMGKIPVIEGILLRMEKKLENGLATSVAENSACLKVLSTLPTQVGTLTSQVTELSRQMSKMYAVKEAVEKRGSVTWERVGIVVALLGVVVVWLEKMGVF